MAIKTGYVVKLIERRRTADYRQDIEFADCYSTYRIERLYPNGKMFAMLMTVDAFNQADRNQIIDKQFAQWL